MRYYLIGSFMIVCVFAWAQDTPLVSLNVKSEPLMQVVEQLEEQTSYEYFYRDHWLDSIEVSIDVSDEPLQTVLDRLLEGTKLHFLIKNQQVFITHDIEVHTSPRIATLLDVDPGAEQSNLEKGLVFAREYLDTDYSSELNSKLFEIGSRSKVKAGGSATVAGYIKHWENEEPLVGVLVYSEELHLSATSDESGFYSITLPLGKHKLVYQLMGLKPAVRNVVLFSNGQLNVKMDIDVMALDEVVIESNREANIQDVKMGVSRISVQETKNVPLVLGERDVMKVATTLAGVQTVGEGAAGFNVRGGKADQNLITLDGAPLYNTSHFFGFFSVLNSEAIDDLQIYKSSIPARYGGRLSSVMDVQSKKANRDSISGSGGISTITSKLTLEAPLFNGNAGLTLAGRTTYSNWMLKRVGNSEFQENRVSFADAMLRYDHDINENNRLRLSGYYSTDHFKMNSDTLFTFSDFRYQNKAISIGLVHQFSRHLSGSVEGIYSAYQYELSYDFTPESAFLQGFDLSEKTLKAELNHSRYADHEIGAGLEVKAISINPGSQSPFGAASLVKSLQIEQEHGIESAAFISDQYTINEDLSLSIGLRYSTFHKLGSQTVYSYLPDSPKNEDTRADSITFGENELIKSYQGLEPRFSARLKLDRYSSIKAAYNRTRQYIHTLTNSASISPTDIWRLSGTYLKPQVSDQLSLGYYRNIERNLFEGSFEVYYKKIQNLLDFKVGSHFLLNPHVETVTLQGPGKSYGFEVSFKKSGRLNGWINYTFARTFIRLDSPYGEERINGGTFYPANYDMPHTLNLVANYKLTHRLSLSYNYTYKSGRPITYPSGVYDFHKSLSIHYSDRNAFRIPYYMRMDLGINLEAGHKKNKLAYSYWAFSVYNVLGRSNPYSVFFSVEGNEIKGHKLVVFGSPIPTITYNFKF